MLDFNILKYIFFHFPKKRIFAIGKNRRFKFKKSYLAKWKRGKSIETKDKVLTNVLKLVLKVVAIKNFFSIYDKHIILMKYLSKKEF